MSEDLTPIRAMCEAYDVTPRTLRFYEAEGLLFPERKGKARRFTATDHARLKLVLRARRYGLSIDEIRGLMAYFDPESRGFTDMAAVQRIARQQHDRLVQRRNDLTGAIDALSRDLDRAQTCLLRRQAA